MPLASSLLCLVLRYSGSNGRSSNVPTYQAQYVQLFNNQHRGELMMFLKARTSSLTYNRYVGTKRPPLVLAP